MMANTALNVQTDSGKAERSCAWCGADISFGQANRTLCSSRCKKAQYNHRNRTKINAKQRKRNRTEPARASRARYNAKIKQDRLRQRLSEKRQVEEASAWSVDRLLPRTCLGCGEVFSPNSSDHSRCKRGCGRRSGSPEHYAEKDRLYGLRNYESVRSRDLEWHRRNAAAAAISLLIMPIESSELNQ